MESRMKVPQKTKNRATIQSSDTTAGHIILWNVLQDMIEPFAHPYLFQCYSQQPSFENSSDVPQLSSKNLEVTPNALPYNLHSL
jgi:hypothetical protein